MTDDEYAFLVASHGVACPPRDRIRLHENQIEALDSLLRVMREMGLDREVRIAAIHAQGDGWTVIDKDFMPSTSPGRRLELEFSFVLFESTFTAIAREEWKS